MKKVVLSGFLSILIATVIATVGYGYNITHPKLQDAYGLAGQAIKDVQDAYQEQKSSGVNFGGHAETAVDLFKKAQAALVEADQYNDSHQKKPK